MCVIWPIKLVGVQQQLLHGEGESFFHWQTCVWSLVADLVFYENWSHTLVLYCEKKHSATTHQSFCFFFALHEEKERAFVRERKRKTCATMRKKTSETDLPLVLAKEKLVLLFLFLFFHLEINLCCVNVRFGCNIEVLGS